MDIDTKVKIFVTLSLLCSLVLIIVGVKALGEIGNYIDKHGVKNVAERIWNGAERS